MNPERHDPLRTAGTFDDFAVSLSDTATLVDPGEHLAEVIGCRRQRRFGRELLAFQFRLVSPGLGFGFVLPGYCNLDVGEPRSRDIPARSKLGRWLRIMQNFDPSISSGRVPLGIFSNYTFLVVVVFPQHDYKRQPLALHHRTPIVQDILRVVGKSQNAQKREEKRLFSALLFSPHLCKV